MLKENRMNTALLLIDIQNDYFENGANPLAESLRASENVAEILEKFRRNNRPVIHVQHLATRPDAIFFIPGTSGAELHHNVKPLSHELVIEKHFPNSFRNTGLLVHLKSLEIEELVICGMMTHMCVDATVRAAKDFGFGCTLIGDACATKSLAINGQDVDAKSVQQSFLAALSYFYAKVINAEEYLSEINL
jgi:nicotinamidase-related amidase